MTTKPTFFRVCLLSVLGQNVISIVYGDKKYAAPGKFTTITYDEDVPAFDISTEYIDSLIDFLQKCRKKDDN